VSREGERGGDRPRRVKRSCTCWDIRIGLRGGVFLSSLDVLSCLMLTLGMATGMGTGINGRGMMREGNLEGMVFVGGGGGGIEGGGSRESRSRARLRPS
jgi:hypothetical protein